MIDDNSLEILVEQLQDPDPIVRATAVHSIGLLGDPAGIKALVWLMADESLWVRCSAAEALGQFRMPQAIDPLVKFLQLGADGELQKIGMPAELPIAFHRFSRAQDPVYTQWLESQEISTPNRGFSLVVSAKLGLQMAGIEATEVLVDMLDNENPYMQYVAVQLLNNMSMQMRPAEALLPCLTDQNDVVRINAIRALARLGNVHVVNPIIALLADESPRVRGAAVEALGKIQDHRAIAPLKAMLDDSEVQHLAWVALNRMRISPGKE